MQTHYLPADLQWGERSRAYWATEPLRTVVIFVHGFGGRAVETWMQFSEMLPETPAGRGCDLLFFGYDGIHDPVRVSALHLLELLQQVLSSPARMMNGTMEEPEAYRHENFSYEKVVLVAHSLGAVVARRALLDAGQKALPGLDRLRLVLFAPAHRGARILALATGVMGAFNLGVPASAFAKWRFPVLRDLEEGSPTLTDLVSDVKEALATAGTDYLRARIVAISNNDKVVVANDFPGDPVPELLCRSHTDLCKPCLDFTDPIRLVLAAS